MTPPRAVNCWRIAGTFLGWSELDLSDNMAGFADEAALSEAPSAACTSQGASHLVH